MKTIENYKGKVIFIVSHGSATEMLFDKFCETKIENNEKKIYFNNKLVHNNDINVLDLLKMEFEENEIVELVKI